MNEVSTTAHPSLAGEPRTMQTEFELASEVRRRYGVSAVHVSLCKGKAVQDCTQKRDTKRIGDISEAAVISAFTKRGFDVSVPFGENHRYDLIVDDGQKLLRVQVKTGRVRNGVIIFNCCSTHGHRRTELKTRPYTGQIELLAMYCPDNEKVYVVPEPELSRSKIQLRLAAPRNNMVKTIRWASQYELA
jgi:PD-(D/E)XK endonuclease